jgi:O-succinylbenzoic acid--CoA ligase
MPGFSLNKKEISYDELKQGGRTGTTEFEKNTLAFCHAWLAGQKEFPLHTSGSTGNPKRILLRREQMEVSARNTLEALSLTSTYTALVCLDTKYIAGQMMLVRSLLAGMNIVAVEPTANPFTIIENRQVDFVALVPYQVEKILMESRDQLDRVKCAIIGGASISNSLQGKLKSVRCSLFATYGMTETISHIALEALNGPNASGCFQAFDTISLRLDDRGCLCIHADYLGEEIITNDLVELIDAKKFRWLGRADNVINSGGVKIIPEKVESELEKIFDRLQLNNRFFVSGIAHASLGEQVTLCIEGTAIDHTTQEKILTAVATRLSRYEMPKAIRFIEKFKETATGKINRKVSVA